MENVEKNVQELQNEINALKEELYAERHKNSFNTALREGGTLIIWAIDQNYQLVSFNQNYFNYFLQNDSGKKIGYEKNGTIKMADASKFWKRKYKQAFSGKANNFEILLDTDGKEQWKEVFLNPIYDTRGTISGISGLAYDITDKMQSKIELIKNEEKFRNIFESFQDLYFRCDINGNLSMVSPSVKDIAGYSETELLGKNITNFYIYNIKTKYLVRQLAQKKRVRNFEANIVHKSGKIIPCICNVSVVQDRKGRLQHFEGVARDITELKKTNEELQYSKELAEKSLKIKERFLANMSHEIRTPLNGIMGMLHLLDETQLDSKQKQHVRTLKGSADILLNILNDLLDLSKIEAGKMELNKSSIHTKSIFKKIFLLYEQQAKDNQISLRYEVSPEVPEYIESDETKLIQVYSNLISNALKFTPANGSVTVTLNVLQKKKKKIILEGTVKDTGIGISKTDQKKLFNSFTQLDSSSSKTYKGTGLGLYISKKIIKLFSGSIGIKSAEGKGSKFWFTFEAKTSQQHTKKPEKPLKLGNSPNILIVDDNMVNLELASEMLKLAGCHITLASSGREAVNKFETTKFDAILMDIQMPDMDGIETAKQIKISRFPVPPIIAMTAYSIDGLDKKFSEMELDDYIAKPIDPATLVSKISYWTSGVIGNGVYEKEKKDKILTINKNTLDLLQKYAGSEAVEDALKEFDKECTHQIKSCSASWDKKDFKEILSILHTLKGNAGTLGVEKIASYAEKMEDDLKEKNYINFEEDLTVLMALHEDFKNHVDAIV